MAKKITKVLGGVKQLEPAMEEITNRDEIIYAVVEPSAGIFLIQHEDKEE